MNYQKPFFATLTGIPRSSNLSFFHIGMSNTEPQIALIAVSQALLHERGDVTTSHIQPLHRVRDHEAVIDGNAPAGRVTAI